MYIMDRVQTCYNQSDRGMREWLGVGGGGKRVLPLCDKMYVVFGRIGANAELSLHPVTRSQIQSAHMCDVSLFTSHLAAGPKAVILCRWESRRSWLRRPHYHCAQDCRGKKLSQQLPPTYTELVSRESWFRSLWTSRRHSRYDEAVHRSCGEQASDDNVIESHAP